MKDLKKYFKVQIPDGYEIDVEQSTFDNIVFKPIGTIYPKSWEEAFSGKQISGYFIASNSSIGTCTRNSVLADKNVFKTDKQAHKFSAYALITQLMALPCYNGDWKPNWSGGETKYVIQRVGNNLNTGLVARVYADIAFKTEEARDAFFSNHMDLLRTYFELD